MKPSLPMHRVMLALLLVLTAWGLTARRPAAHALEKAAATPAPAAPTLVSLLSGTAYATTLKASDIDSSFQRVDLVDTQGKPGTYATKGETATVGGETFLVAYFAAPGQPVSATIPPAATLHLAFINMRYVQAMLNPRAAAAAP